MHEASLMKNLMRQILDVVAAEQATHAVGVEVWVGALSHMSPEHFREHFRESSAGTAAEGATISVTTSDDIAHPQAMDVVLLGVEVES
jgi:hydrogenase nickel incorporation protein HypA/HybF